MSTSIRGVDDITGSTDPVNISQNKLHIAQYVWDTNTLSWVKQTGASGGTGADVVVTNLPATQAVTQSGVWSIDPSVYTKRYDSVDSTTAYLGEAAVGTGEGAASWRIQKLVFGVDGDVTTLFANGATSFNQIWTNRAGLSYS